MRDRAPLKLTSGALLVTPEPGAIEFLNDKYYGTITTGSARKEFAFVGSTSSVQNTLFAGSQTCYNGTGWHLVGQVQVDGSLITGTATIRATGRISNASDCYGELLFWDPVDEEYITGAFASLAWAGTAEFEQQSMVLDVGAAPAKIKLVSRLYEAWVACWGIRTESYFQVTNVDLLVS